MQNEKELELLSRSNENTISSKEDALSEIDRITGVIRKFEPKKPDWFHGKNANKPLLDEENGLAILAGDSFIFASLGATAGGGVGALTALFPFVTIWEGTAIGLLLGASTLTMLSLGGAISYFYGGSKTHQPIRKFLAQAFFKPHRLVELDRRVQDYEDYLVALKTHQMVINDARMELAQKGVFEMLSSANEVHSLSEDGRHKVDKIIEIEKAYTATTDKMIEHLKNKANERKSEPDMSQLKLES